MHAVGSIIRFNIRHAEPVLAANPGEALLSFEHASDLALVLAYVISVCLYLRILSAFVLDGLGADTPLNESLVTSFVIVLITVIGTTRGLAILNFLEKWALYITLLIIVIILGGFAYYDWTTWQSPAGIILPSAASNSV